MKFKKVPGAIEKLRNIFPNTKIGVVLYNGTDEDFTDLDFDKVNIHDDGYLGKGFYLTADPYTATEYGNIIKHFYVNLTNPLCFNDISDKEAGELAKVIVQMYSGSIRYKKSPTFYYWLSRKSNDEALQDIAHRIDTKQVDDNELKAAIKSIILTPEYIIDGALMDFSDIITRYIRYKGYDGAYINSPNIKYYEVVVYHPEQVFLIK